MIIKERRADAFRSRKARIRELVGLVSIARIDDVGEAITFQDMLALRKEVDAEEMHILLKTGFLAANVGAAVAAQVVIEGKRYAAMVYQERPAYGDTVLNLCSGYSPADETLEQTAFQELCEELLIQVDGKFVRIKGILDQEEHDYNPFPTLDWNGETEIQQINVPGYVRAAAAPILGTKRGMAGYFSKYSAGQAYFGCEIKVPSGASLMNTNEIFNPETGMLETMLLPDNLVVVALDEGDLTDQVYRLRNGELEPVPTEELWLSEAFVKPNSNGIVRETKIRLEDYLRNI